MSQQTGRNRITSNYSTEWITTATSLAPVPFELTRDGARFDLTTGSPTIKIYLIATAKWLGMDFNPEAYDTFWQNATASDIDREVNGATVAIDVAAKGTLLWTPSADDVDRPGRYYTQLTVTKAGVVYFFPDAPWTFVGSIVPSLALS